MPVTSDQPVVFTANVSGCNPGEPREVRWYLDGSLVEVDAAPGPYDYTVDASVLIPGTYTIRADVIGDGNDLCTAGSVVSSTSDTLTVPAPLCNCTPTTDLTAPCSITNETTFCVDTSSCAAADVGSISWYIDGQVVGPGGAGSYDPSEADFHGFVANQSAQVFQQDDAVPTDGGVDYEKVDFFPNTPSSMETVVATDGPCAGESMGYVKGIADSGTGGRAEYREAIFETDGQPGGTPFGDDVYIAFSFRWDAPPPPVTGPNWGHVLMQRKCLIANNLVGPPQFSVGYGAGAPNLFLYTRGGQHDNWVINSDVIATNPYVAGQWYDIVLRHYIHDVNGIAEAWFGPHGTVFNQGSPDAGLYNVPTTFMNDDSGWTGNDWREVFTRIGPYGASGSWADIELSTTGYVRAGSFDVASRALQYGLCAQGASVSGDCLTVEPSDFTGSSTSIRVAVTGAGDCAGQSLLDETVTCSVTAPAGVSVAKTATEQAPVLYDNFDSNPVAGIGDQIAANPYGSVEACTAPALGNSVRISYPSGSVGGGGGGIGGMDFPFSGGQKLEEAYFRFRVKFDTGFQFARTGKLPGLAGGSQPGGGGAPGGCSGFSARQTWDTEFLSSPGVGASAYLYYHDQPAFWGDRHNYAPNGDESFIVPGQWYCFEQRVKMNTPNVDDGEYEVWVNGDQAVLLTDVNWRTCAQLQIDGVMFSSFFGGNAAEDASPQNQFACFDDFHVSTKRIGC